MTTRSKMPAIYKKVKPIRDVLHAHGRCMEVIEEKHGILVERWVMGNGRNLVLFATPHWYDVFAPLTTHEAVSATHDAIERYVEAKHDDIGGYVFGGGVPQSLMAQVAQPDDEILVEVVRAGEANTPITLGQFIAENIHGLDGRVEIAAIRRAMALGGEYHGGGGAALAWTLRRA